jgi:hypothetical protein
MGGSWHRACPENTLGLRFSASKIDQGNGRQGRNTFPSHNLGNMIKDKGLPFAWSETDPFLNEAGWKPNE